MTYLIFNEDGREIRAGWDDRLLSYLVTVVEDGTETYRYEYECAVAALDDVARQMGVDRVSSVWLWRLTGDRHEKRLPRPATRHHEAPGGSSWFAPDPVAA